MAITATDLVNTGSDACFMLAGFAAKAGCVISTVSEVQAPAENGTNMRSQQACLDCSYSIQGQEFSTDFTLLEVPRI